MRRFWVLVLVGVAATASRGLQAQKSGGAATAATPRDANAPSAKISSTVNLSTLADPERVRREVEQAAKEAKAERQKRIQKDTDKLLKLAVELKSEVESMAVAEVSAATIRKTEQIEKLAHDVGQRTRKK
jgi:hypothetical protein